MSGRDRRSRLRDVTSVFPRVILPVRSRLPGAVPLPAQTPSRLPRSRFGRSTVDGGTSLTADQVDPSHQWDEVGDTGSDRLRVGLDVVGAR